MPKLAADQAAKAVATLEQLGLLTRNENGRLVRGDVSLTTGHEVRAVVVPAYHRQMIERAGAAVDDVPPDERDISALTVCIKAASLSDLKQKIHRFREEMLNRSDSDEQPERVYQLCVQLFPLSKTPPAPARVVPRKTSNR
jgi:uncharacterized protein (TIGR02147 family)